MILKTPNVWGTRKNGVCPCSPFLGTPASSYNRPIDIGKNKWGTANCGLDSLLLNIWQATHTYLLISWLPVTTHTWFDSFIHYQHTGYIVFIIICSPSYKSLFKSRVRTYTSNASREEDDAGHRRVQSQQEYPVRTFVKSEGEKPYQISFFLCYSVRNSVTYHLFTFHPSEYKNALQYRLIWPNLAILCK